MYCGRDAAATRAPLEVRGGVSLPPYVSLSLPCHSLLAHAHAHAMAVCLKRIDTSVVLCGLMALAQSWREPPRHWVRRLFALGFVFKWEFLGHAQEHK